MSKVLIASFGNPRRRPDTRDYIATTYVLPDADGKPTDRQCESSFIFEALVQLVDIDKLILIGTAGSLWNSLYEYLYYQDKSPLRREGLQPDDRFLATLNELNASALKSQMNTRDVANQLKPLEESFNEKYHVKLIVMRYGLTAAEWDENLGVLREIEGMLKDGDELYLDVTYSFRSLPIFQLLSVFYFRNISRKNVELKMLSYGMFEARSEFEGMTGQNVTPIVDLRRLYELMEYIQVAGEYRNFGTTYGLDALTDSGEPVPGLSPAESRLIRNLGDMVTINNLQGFVELVNSCEHILNRAPENGELSLLARAICEDILQYFGEGIGDPIMTQFNLAKWHMEKKRYLNAVATARETCVSFAMQLCGDANDTYEQRNLYNNLYSAIMQNHGLDDITRRFVFLYGDLRKVRNMLAHPTAEFSMNDKRALVDILLIDDLRIREKERADDTLRKLWNMRDEAVRKNCLRELQNLPTRNGRKEELAGNLPDPFDAVIAAIHLVINKLHDCYQQNYFVSDGNTAAEGNRTVFANALLQHRENDIGQ